MLEEVKVMDSVIYVDEQGEDRPALVTAVWDKEYSYATKEPGLNLVFVCKNENQQDQYGRQTERRSSIIHQTGQPAHGNCWRRNDEVNLKNFKKRININGIYIDVLEDKMDYDQIVKLAGYKDDKHYTVTYAYPSFVGKKGRTLTKGEDVFIYSGTMFNVADTSNT